MKVNRRDPKHWYWLLRSGMNVVVSSPFRLAPRRHKRPRIVFYDQMNGNTKAFVSYLQENNKKVDMYFLAFPEFQELYKNEHDLPTLSPLRLRDMIKVARSDAVITNFGTQTVVFYTWLTNLPFIDVWHGIPIFKGFVPKDFNSFGVGIQRYREVWVSSPQQVELYKNKFEIGAPVVATGYARVDKIVNGEYKNVREKYGLPKNKKLVMLAPTWKQDDAGRAIVPFGVSEHDFIKGLDELGEKLGCLMIFRAHRASGRGVNVDDMRNVRFMSASDYPDTEELLSEMDVLVSDWSSIVFDYLPLRRPTIFLDVEPPFKNGFSVSDKYRFGEVVGSYPQLLAAIGTYYDDPAAFRKKYRKIIKETEEVAYGPTLDGKAAERYWKRLQKIIKN